MSLIQFWRILLARKMLIFGTMLCCLLGGVAIILVVPPRWQADARVYLNLLKPDPITGEVIANNGAGAYILTQIALISDYTVAGRAVDKLGWLSDPILIQQYQNRSKNDTRDFRHWLAQLIIDRTKVGVLDQSNILDISYTGSSPGSAKAVADAVMQSYLETSVALKRADADKSADWYEQQAQKTKQALEAAQLAVTTYERENGVVLTQDEKTDVDTARLAAMAMQGSAADGIGGNSADAQLAQTEAELRNALRTLGPNHPEVQTLQAKAAALNALIARERTAAAGASKAAPASGIDAQKALVISERDKLAKLRNLQTEVEIQRDLYNKMAQKEEDSRVQSAITDAGLTPLGSASVPQAPTFPNKLLIIGGCLGLGLFLGTLVALLIEFLNRRVRGAEDLQSALDVPLLTVLAAR
ncbi:MAG TPA: GNVR domain-containing protein [Rhizomicrobium sp.]|nr:GNVR domain-containing protein [Rhizomicrobium sp.]